MTILFVGQKDGKGMWKGYDYATWMCDEEWEWSSFGMHASWIYGCNLCKNTIYLNWVCAPQLWIQNKFYD